MLINASPLQSGDERRVLVAGGGARGDAAAAQGRAAGGGARALPAAPGRRGRHWGRCWGRHWGRHCRRRVPGGRQQPAQLSVPPRAGAPRARAPRPALSQLCASVYPKASNCFIIMSEIV